MSDRQPFAGDDADTEELDLESQEGTLEDAMKAALDAVDNPTPKTASSSDEPFVQSIEDSDLRQLREEVKELRDRSMRTLADFDNFRKRVERERGEQSKYSGAEVLRDILSVVDNLERALGSEGGVDEVKEGVELILRQVMDLLTHHGVERILSESEEFDPAVHEAVLRHETTDVEVPTIVKEMQAGYWMKDRLLRPALVEVAVPIKIAETAPAQEGTEE